jgi:hypothetical protein
MSSTETDAEAMYPGLSGPGPFIVTHNGRRFHVRMQTANEVFAFLQRWQGQSVNYALTQNGYAVHTVPADRWSDIERDDYGNTARNVMYGDPYHNSGACRRGGPDERENCAGCVLRGYTPRGGWGDDINVRRDGPNYAGWARVYVESQTAIPARWRDAFERELHSDNEAYAAALALSVATFGVHFH